MVTIATEVAAVTEFAVPRPADWFLDAERFQGPWRSTSDRSPGGDPRPRRGGSREQRDRVRARHQRAGGEGARLPAAPAAGRPQSRGPRRRGGDPAVQWLIRHPSGVAAVLLPGRAGARG